jgi:hypothetical protein
MFNLDASFYLGAAFAMASYGRIQRKTWCMGPYAGVDYNQRHQHRQVSRMPDTDLIPNIQLKGVKSRIFSKDKRKRSYPLPRSFSIFDEPDF